MTTTERKANKLNARQTYLAAAWLKDADLTGLHNYRDLAAKIEAAMGFEVTEANARGLLLEVVQRELPPAPGTPVDRLQALEDNAALDRQHVDDQIEDLRKQVAEMARRATNLESFLFATMQALAVLEGSLEAPGNAKLHEERKKRMGTVRAMMADAGQFPVIFGGPVK